MLRVNAQIQIPLREFDFSFSRSSGAGGQNVNKVNTKVTLHWDLDASPSLNGAVKARFRARFGRRLTTAGVLVIQSQRFRDQGRNVADCLEKLRQMLLEVATAPKARRATKPGRGARERRLRDKRKTGERKQRRARVTGDD